MPALEKLEDLTDIPDRRVVFNGVDWAFYDRLVDSIPEWRRSTSITTVRTWRLSGSHSGTKSQMYLRGYSRALVAAGSPDPRRLTDRRSRAAAVKWPLRRRLRRRGRVSYDPADYPNPDLAIEVGSLPPAGRSRRHPRRRCDVAEVWRFDGRIVIIDRLTADGTYTAADASLFLPVRTEEIQRWVVDKAQGSESDWVMRLRAEIRKRAAKQSKRKGKQVSQAFAVSRSGFPA